MNWWSVQDVERLTGLSKSTIRRHLTGNHTPGGHNRYSVSEVHAFCVKLGLI
jgi:hypothetical protein